MPGYPFFVALHVLCGTVALIAFWSAAALRKGSPRHRLAGRVFLVAMCGILATGVPLALHFLLTARPNGAAFLGYLLVITAQAMWMAWRAITDKRDWRAMVARPGWRALQLASLLSGLAILTLGLVRGEALFLGFSMVGIVLGAQMWRFARRGPRHLNWHVVQHYQAILGCGIATHIAFLGIGMRPLWAWLRTHASVPEQLTFLLPWFAPLAVAIAAGIWLDRKWARPLPAAPASGSAPVTQA